MPDRVTGYVSHWQMLGYLFSMATALLGILYAGLVFHGHSGNATHEEARVIRDEVKEIHKDVREIRQFLMEKMTNANPHLQSSEGPQ